MAFRGYPFVLVLVLLAVACKSDPVPPPPPVEEPARPVPPASPGAVRAEAEVGGATLTWSAPAETGSSALTGYQVESEPREASQAIVIEGTTARVTGLRAGGTYRFSVVARNEAGVGPASVSAAITLPDVPGAPEGVSAVRGNRQVQVAWTAPLRDGGRPVLGYLVTARPQGTQLRVEAPVSSAVVTGLTNGVASTWTVRALNAVGEGPESQPSERVVPAAVPSAPGAVSATPGVKELTVTWSEPADTGGLPILEYRVTVEPEGLVLSAEGSARSVTVTGLRDGSEHTLRVVARNNEGEGLAASTSQRTLDLPGAPQDVSVLRGSRQVTVSWKAPASDGGTPVTGYTVEVQPTGRRVDVGGDAREVTVTELSSTGDYRFTVTAFNVVGTGPVSSRSASVRPLPGPARVPALSVPATAGACLSISYSLGQDDGERADVLVEVAAQGNGTFRPATQAGSTDHEGTIARSTSMGGTTHRFLWNRALDVRGAASVQVRVSARVAGAVAGSRTVAVSLPAANRGCETSLEGAQVSAIQQTPYAGTTGDFDGDGKLDLIVGTQDYATPTFLKGLGNGYFLPGQRLELGVLGHRSLQYASADLDGDGAVDLLWVENGPVLAVARGLGNGAFGPVQRYTPGTGLWLDSGKPGFAVADFNGDGRLDVAMNSASQGAGLFLNQGQGTFAAFQPLGLGSGPLLAADIDADGRQDLVLPGTVLLSNGDGTFRPQSTTLPAELMLGDFDRDGRVDAVLVSDRDVLLRRGNGQGGFAVATRVATLAQSLEVSSVTAGNMTAADLDGDGVLDLAFATNHGWNSHLLALFKGRGDGTFAAEVGLPVPRISSFLTRGDFNGDAIADLVALPSASQWTGQGEWRLRDVRVWPGGADRMARSTPMGPRGTLGTGDLNDDGWADVISVGRESDASPPNTSLVTLRWGGPGGLSAPQTVLDLSNEHLVVYALDIVRVDADLSLDVVIHGDDQTIFLLNEGGGTLRRVAGPQLDRANHVESGDVNKDGKPDLVYTVQGSSQSSPQVRLRLGVGDGTFGAAVTLSDTSSGSESLVDLNQDGSLDVILLQAGATGIAAKVLLGQGDGTFTAGPALALGGPGSGQALRTVDMDRDGIPDVVYCSSMSGEPYALHVLRGTGDGSFTLASSAQTASSCVLHVVDLDGDGWRDVLAASWLTDSVTLWSGRPQGQLAPERIFGTYLHDPNSVARSLAVVDANGDGRLDVLSGLGGRVTTLLLQR